MNEFKIGDKVEILDSHEMLQKYQDDTEAIVQEIYKDYNSVLLKMNDGGLQTVSSYCITPVMPKLEDDDKYEDICPECLLEENESLSIALDEAYDEIDRLKETLTGALSGLAVYQDKYIEHLEDIIAMSQSSEQLM